MGFGTGFVTGLASSVDKMLQLDIQRNMDRMTRAETYLAQRQADKIERAEQQERELEKELRELSALTGNNRRAGLAAKGVGGTIEGIKELNTKLKRNKELLGDKYSLETFIDFTGEDKLGEDPIAFSDLLSSFTSRVSSPTINPEYTRPTGMMAALTPTSMLKSRDIAGDVDKYMPVPERFREDRTDIFADVPAATIDFSKGVDAAAYAAQLKTGELANELTEAKIAEYSKNKDDKFKSLEAILSYGTQLMLENEPGSEEYTTGKQYYDKAMAGIREKKVKETDDNKTSLTPSAARGIANQIKANIYEAPFSETFQDSIRAKLVGTDSYKSFFRTQPKVIEQLQSTNTRFNNDLTMTSLIQSEQVAYSNNIQTYVEKFSMRPVDENKATTFDNEGKFIGYNKAIPIDVAEKEARAGTYQIGDIINARVDGNEVIVVWTGTDWSNGG